MKPYSFLSALTCLIGDPDTSGSALFFFAPIKIPILLSEKEKWFQS